MNQDKTFLGTEPIGKLLRQLAIPTVIAQLVNMLYNIVDRIYIGHIPGDGDLALTGVGVCLPLILIVSAFAALVASGGAPRASIYMGKQDHDTAEKILGGCFALQLAVSAVLTAVLLLWIPIRQMPGLGSVSNVIVLGLAADATLAVLPPLESMVARSALLVGAIVLNAIATGMYIGAGFGPGPRDGLMTGLHARTGWSLRGIRTAIELSVLLIGWLLGGKFGVGTVIYALSIGPLIQLCLPWFSQPVSRNAVSPPREIVS